MSDICAFIFCLGLGIASRLLYMGSTALSRRTDLFPVTVILDTLTVAAVGAALSAYVILTSAVIAPYMFIALIMGYMAMYGLTKGLGSRAWG